MTAQEITRLREAILRALYPLAAVATYPTTILRDVRHDGNPATTLADVEQQLTMLQTLGKVELIQTRPGGVSPADRGWKLTASGLATAEEIICG